MQPAVFEQVLRDFLARDGGVHGQAVGLRVPIGRAAVLFAGEALGADVELRVLAVIGGEELEDVEADALLAGHVAVDAHVGLFPAARPRALLLAAQRVVARFLRAEHARRRGAGQLVVLVVAVGRHADEFIAADGLPGLDVEDELAGDVALLDGDAVFLRLFGRHGGHRAADGEARRAERIFAGAGAHGEHAVFILVLALEEPEGLVVVGILVAHVRVDGGDQRDLAVVIRRHAAAQRHQLRPRHGNEALEGDAHRALFAADDKFAGEHARAHIQHAGEGNHVVLVQIDVLPVDANAQGDDVHRVDDLAEILRVAVFPPAHARLIREPDARQIGAAVTVAGIALFKVAAHAHVAVADGGHGFGQAHVVLVQLGFNQPPGIKFKNCFHGDILTIQLKKFHLSYSMPLGGQRPCHISKKAAS